MKRVNHILLLTFAVIFIFTPAYPVETEGYLNVGGADIFFKIAGQGESLVIIHGGPGLAHNYLYDPFLQLSDQYKLIFYDQRGCGRSSAFLDKKPDTMDIMIEDLEGLRKEMQLDSMILVGQSWGALIAFHYYFKYPGNVSKLLLLEPASSSSDYTPQVIKTINSRLTPEEKNKLQELSDNFDLKTNLNMHLEYRKILMRTYFVNKELAAENPFKYFDNSMLEKFFATSERFATYRSSYDLNPRLEQVKCPVLIIHGDYDIVPTESVERMSELIKNSTLHIIKNCGHFVHIEKPDDYFRLIREFLKQGQIYMCRTLP